MSEPVELSIRENYLRTLEFRFPQWIPSSVNFAPIVWNTYREALERIVLDHPRIFPDYTPSERDFYDEMPLVYREGEYYQDNWGCTWYTALKGLEGQVVKSPLENWHALASYQMPDPITTDEREHEFKDWDKTHRELAKRKSQGKIVSGDH